MVTLHFANPFHESQKSRSVKIFGHLSFAADKPRIFCDGFLREQNLAAMEPGRLRCAGSGDRTDTSPEEHCPEHMENCEGGHEK
ncbi:hypothetical protein AVEN_88508-1 [Araneus ventricosus]|uniref:Uncharacterized protein n=1 Tax=Araneus ventricosus TaxID=182803 RepID=A0A4Y2IVT3_ARAVE|nr:hypothetical protein AVEN_261369-1 [Araneus ventricosus]GBM76162.1 hypothetical protein AVEN_55186-1 [Araneus ventricosus]GBM81549.1 hypothetical protein AVEN_64571-1 [Araneus ventricosus]GBM81770.1 hypothetical protein AVEN_88508-1 [Araneus ventricosus]